MSHHFHAKTSQSPPELVHQEAELLSPLFYFVRWIRVQKAYILSHWLTGKILLFCIASLSGWNGVQLTGTSV